MRTRSYSFFPFFDGFFTFLSCSPRADCFPDIYQSSNNSKQENKSWTTLTHLSRDIFTNTHLRNGRLLIDSHSVNVNIKYLRMQQLNRKLTNIFLDIYHSLRYKIFYADDFTSVSFGHNFVYRYSFLFVPLWEIYLNISKMVQQNSFDVRKLHW